MSKSCLRCLETPNKYGHKQLRTINTFNKFVDYEIVGNLQADPQGQVEIMGSRLYNRFIELVQRWPIDQSRTGR